MASIFTTAFWAASSERAIKTGAQSALSAFAVGDVALNAFHADWASMGGIFLGGIVLSVLTSLASGASTGAPSLGNLEVPTIAGRHEGPPVAPVPEDTP